MNSKEFSIIIILFIASVLLSACNLEDDMETNIHKIATVDGLVQKGPFINGSTVTMDELDDSFTLTGKTFSTDIIDNKGSFSFSNIGVKSGYVQLSANGYYFDEVKGEKSLAPLKLNALVDITKSNQANINVLSHLEKERILFLVKQKITFSEAKKQAQREVLAVFGIHEFDGLPFENMNITKQGDENAVLLAISATLQSQNTVAELSELLANVISDIREDGTLDSENLKERIRKGSSFVSPSNVRNNLKLHYEALEEGVTIPNFEKYLDSDGDGVLNDNDDEIPENFAFTDVTDAKRDTVYTSETITLEGLPYPTYYYLSRGEFMTTLVVNGVEENIEGGLMLMSGDKIAVKIKTSPHYSTASTATLTVGEFSTTWTVSTEADPWVRETYYPSYAAYDYAFAELNGNIYIGLGASYHGSLFKEFFEYNPTSMSWSKKADFPGKSRHSPSSFTSGKFFYVGFGKDENYKGLRDVWEFDSEFNSWTQLDDFPIEYSNLQKSFLFSANSSTYSIMKYEKDGTTNTELWFFNSDGKFWEKDATIDKDIDNLQFLFVIDNKAYFRSGTDNELVMFEPKDHSWTKLGSMPETNIATSLNSKGYSYHKDNIYVYDPNINNWNLVETISPNYVTYSSIIAVSESIFFISETSSAAKCSFTRYLP